MGFGDSPFGTTPFGRGAVVVVVGNSWTLRARGPGFVGGKVYQDWSAVLVERHNTPDTLQIIGSLDSLRGLLEPGMGVTLEDSSGIRFSGPLTQFTKRGDQSCVATFASDLIWLWGRVCYPDPTSAWTSQSASAYDIRTGPAETVALDFINANAGPGALVERQVSGLVVPASAGLGGTTKVSARFDNLGQLVSDIAEAAGLRLRVIQNGTNLDVSLTTVADLSGWARFGTHEEGGPGQLAEDWDYKVKMPEVTHAMVAGEGDLTARVTRERSDLAASSLWSNRVEVFIDQNNTTDTAELDAAGDKALLDGANPLEVGATIPDVDGLRLGTNVPIGSIVALDLDGDVVTDRLRQVATTIGPDGDTKAGVVGSPTAGLTQDQKRFFALRRSLRKVQAR